MSEISLFTWVLWVSVVCRLCTCYRLIPKTHRRSDFRIVIGRVKIAKPNASCLVTIEITIAVLLHVLLNTSDIIS